MREPTPNEGNSCLSQLVAKESPPLGQKKEERNFLAAKERHPQSQSWLCGGSKVTWAAGSLGELRPSGQRGTVLFLREEKGAVALKSSGHLMLVASPCPQAPH